MCHRRTCASRKRAPKPTRCFRRAGPRWTLEAGGSVEASRLTQSGDATRETELTYWKPSIQLVRAIGERDQVRFRFYRDVGQLDFEDFVSAAEITGLDRRSPAIQTCARRRSWRFEAAGDWRFGEDGASA